MGAIDKLKNNSGIISFDTTTSSSIKTVAAGESMDIDMVNNPIDNIAVEVDKSPEMNLGNLRKGNHQMVYPKEKINAENRTAVSISEVGSKPVVNEDDIHISPQDDILNIENENSLFAKYVAQKDAEAIEWIAEKEEEKRILEEEKAMGIDPDDEKSEYGIYNENNNDSDEGFIVSGNEELDQRMVGSYNMNNIENEDLSGLLGEDDHPERSDAAEVAYYKETYNDETEYSDDIEVDVNVIADDNSSTSTEIIEDEEISEEDNTEDILKHLQLLATEKLKPVSKKLNINSFTVLKKPVSNVAPIFKETSARVSKWVLPTQQSIVLMKEFSGAELEKLREYSENSRSIDSINRRFNLIYSHIMSPKPASFETWLKTTPFDDVDSYFFAIYIASFKGANYLPADCPNPQCKETFLSDDIDIMNMVEFENDVAKKKFAELYQSEAVPAGKGIYCTEIVPMNEKIAISFRQPSIYNVFEMASMDEKTRSEYSSIVDYIPYIDQIYSIDMMNETLTPIGYKMFSDNNQRTIRSKIQKYNQILTTLSVDEFAIIKAYVKAIAEKNSGIYYVYPSIECPKCHNTTEKQRTTAEELVFTRYQLGSLVNTSLN